MILQKASLAYVQQKASSCVELVGSFGFTILQPHIMMVISGTSLAQAVTIFYF
jgi:hypothetical protein